MSRRGRTAKEKDIDKNGLYVRILRDEEGVALSIPRRYKVDGGGSASSAAPGGGDKNDCSGTSAYRNGSCSSVSTELLGRFGQ